MADVLQRAPSGRAKCRGCGRVIAKGELRFGESFENPYAEGDARSWFHVPCAAMTSPTKLLAVLESATEALPEEDWLRRTAEVGAAHRRLPRLAGAERASSGRAHCRHCHELIGKGAFRLRLQVFEDGRMVPLGYLHPGCAGGYFETTDILDRIERLTPTASAAEHAELALALGAEPAPLAPLAKAEPQPEQQRNQQPDQTARKSG